MCILKLIIFFGNCSIFQVFVQVFWECGLFPTICENIDYLGMKFPEISCKIWEFCIMLKSLFSAPLDTLKIPYSVHIKCIRRTLGNILKSIPVIQSIMVHKRTQAVQLQIHVVMTSVGNRPELHNRLSVFINQLIINYLKGVGENGIFHNSMHKNVFCCLFVVVYVGHFASYLFSHSIGTYLLLFF